MSSSTSPSDHKAGASEEGRADSSPRRRHGFWPWLLAVLICGAIELTIFVVKQPTPIERSDFLVFPLKRDLALSVERWVLYEKLRSLEVENPIAVHVGDSSGYFGLMPDVVEEYLGGLKIFNLSCCANQGFHGYLALLEAALEKHSSLKYLITHMAPRVHPSPALWRGAGDLQLGNNASLPVLGEDMEKNMSSPWRHLYPPSNVLRPDITAAVLLGGADPLAPGFLEVKSQYGMFWERKGYQLESDIETPLDCGIGVPRDRDGVSYLELYIREFVELARRHHVTPVLYFHPTYCYNDDVHKAFEEELERVKLKYPDLRVPLPFVETWPWHFFSVPAHVQRGAAIETSRRMGRTLRALFEADGVLPEAARHRAEAVKALPQAQAPGGAVHILGAVKQPVCDVFRDWRTKPYESDMTRVLMDACEGQRTCAYDKRSDPREAADQPGCKPYYNFTYRCGDGPIRSLRDEGPDGKLYIQCHLEEAMVAADPMPYGIQVVSATYGANTLAPYGNITLFSKARCDGLSDCRFAVVPERWGDPAPGQPKDVVVEYYCGRSGASRRAVVPAGGDEVHLWCDALPPHANGIQIVEGWADAAAPDAPSDPGLTARLAEACDGRKDCDPPASGRVAYRCGSGPVRTGLPVRCDDDAPPARSMVVTEATWGAACGAPANNALFPLKIQCDGKQQCAPTLPSTVPTQAPPGCQGALDLSYQCEGGPERTARFRVAPGETGAVRLDCAADSGQTALLR